MLLQITQYNTFAFFNVDVNIQNLIPENLRSSSVDEFLGSLESLNEEYQTIKENQEPKNVLRYIGELGGDLSKEKGNLNVKLVPKDFLCKVTSLLTKNVTQVSGIYVQHLKKTSLVKPPSKIKKKVE